MRCVQELDIPQFISLNLDGPNDAWEIPGFSQYPENVVKVFNRWETLVFEQKGYVTGWGGSANESKGANQLWNNKMLPEGTYYYLIDLNDDSFELYVGYLQIKRYLPLLPLRSILGREFFFELLFLFDQILHSTSGVVIFVHEISINLFLEFNVPAIDCIKLQVKKFCFSQKTAETRG